jgi:acetaldehyde dehydrogenase
MMTSTTKVAIIGSGNIGTDLMIKVLRMSETLEMGAMVGIDPESDGLARAQRMKVPTTHEGVEGLVAMDGFDAIDVVFDATSAGAHRHNASVLEPYGKRLIDLTPAAMGPFVVPAVNLGDHLDAMNVNMVTCGGQATIPIVAAVRSVTEVYYAEIVASIASKSAGPGTRANIDEFTETTAKGLEVVGGAERGKAVIVLNPAEPPLVMRDTVFCLAASADEALVVAAVHEMVDSVAKYVPGYRLKQGVQVDPITMDDPLRIPDLDRKYVGLKVTVMLEVEGAAHYLPKYAGNLDIMTSAALQTAESLVARAAAASSAAMSNGER